MRSAQIPAPIFGWTWIGFVTPYMSTCEMHGHSDAQVCSQRLDALAQVVQLYRGDLMESTGLRDSAAFDEWQFFQTESLRQAFAAALEKLVHGHSARGEFGPAIRYARAPSCLGPTARTGSSAPDAALCPVRTARCCPATVPGVR